MVAARLVTEGTPATSATLQRVGNRVNSKWKPDTDMLKHSKNPTKRWYGRLDGIKVKSYLVIRVLINNLLQKIAQSSFQTFSKPRMKEPKITWRVIHLCIDFFSLPTCVSTDAR